MSNIRLIECEQGQIVLSQLNKEKEEIEFLESLFLELHYSEDKAATLPTKIAVLADLTACYHNAGYRVAAIECLKRMEPLFFDMLETAARPVQEDMCDMLITGYLLCGSIDDAIQVAEATARAVAKILATTDEERDFAFNWLNNHFQLEIKAFQNRCERKAVQMHNLPECNGACEADQSFVINLRTPPLLGA